MIREIGVIEEYIEAMWLINNASIPDDYIIGSGKLHSVEDLIKIVFNYLDLDWKNLLELIINLKDMTKKQIY